MHRSVLEQRLDAQLLTGRGAASPVEVAERLLAVQGQDPRGARLAVRSRSRGLHAGDVDRALTADRSLLITTLNRGTLHLVCSEDYWWLHPLTTPQLLSGNARRLGQEGVSPDAAERGVQVVVAALGADGPLGRRALGDRLRAADVPTAGQALVHVLMLAALQGHVVRGPMIDGDHAYVLVRDWLGAPPPALDREVALGRLAHRYLAGHGPAADSDLARWAGIGLREARCGLAAIRDALVERADGLAALRADGRAGVRAQGLAALRRQGTGSDLRTPGEPGAGPAPALLGAFDPVLLGWSDREPIVGGHASIVTSNGLFRPFALVGGRAVGTWSYAGGRVALAPFGRLTPEVDRALQDEAADVARFLGAAQPGASRVARNASDRG